MDQSAQERVTVTFQGEAAQALRNMAARQDVSVAELARRALLLMDVYMDLDPREALAVTGENGALSTLRMPWELHWASER